MNSTPPAILARPRVEAFGALICAILLGVVPAFGQNAPGAEEAPVVARARAVLAEKGGDGAARGDLLAAYADTLRQMDVVLSARCLEVAGIGAFRAGNLDSAIARWQRGVQWASQAEAMPTESSLLNALAIGHTARGDVEAALPVYERSLELRESLQDTVGLSRTWGNLAQAYVNIGRTAEAMQATVVEEKWLGLVDNPRGRVANAIRRGQILAAQGRFDEALIQGRTAVAMAEDFGGEFARGMAAMGHGNALLDLGRPEEALPILAEAKNQLIAAGDEYTAAFVEQSLVQCLLVTGQYEEALVRARDLARLTSDSGHDPLLTVAERLAANALFAGGRIDEAESTLVVALDRFEQRREELSDSRSRAGIFKASGELYASLARCQLEKGRQNEAFLTVERGRAAAFRDRAGVALATVPELQAAVASENAALILFNDPVWDPLTAYILDGNGVTVVELGAAAPLAADARAALRLLAAGESLADCAPVLERLDAALARPILSVLDESIARAMIVPPSFLAGFPFDLLGAADGAAWGDRYPLTYLPNASSLLRLSQREVPKTGILALADPDLPSQSGSRLPISPARAGAGVPLPEARTEILAVAAEEGDRRVGAEASGQALRAALTGPIAILHLATHAVVDPVDGGRSAVVLAGPDGVDEVTATEIASYDFAGDLVVLSGCSTFGEHRVPGEGWFGLPRSFLAAGARSVISTLWDVEDAGARTFVTAFYDALATGANRDEALAIARRSCRDQGLPPREWAAFVLSGVGSEPVPLLVKGGFGGMSQKPSLVPAGVLLGLVAGGVLWRRLRN